MSSFENRMCYECKYYGVGHCRESDRTDKACEGFAQKGGRPIDANELKLRRGIAGDPVLHEIIDSQPTMDVNPAVMSWWIIDKDSNDISCRKCGEKALKNDKGLPVPSKWCPHCGAEMHNW